MFSRLASWGRYMIGDTFSAANEGLKGRIVADLAQERGQVGRSTRCVDIVIDDDLRTVLWPLPSDSDAESWKLRAEAWDHPLVMIGGSDAGAHLDRMCGAPYPTKFLGDCLRGRKLVSMERCVQLMTQIPAELFGLRDRGTIARGLPRRPRSCSIPRPSNTGEVKLVDDLPGGTSAACSPTRSACTRDRERHDDRRRRRRRPTPGPAPCCAPAATPTRCRSPPTRSQATPTPEPRARHAELVGGLDGTARAARPRARRRRPVARARSARPHQYRVRATSGGDFDALLDVRSRPRSAHRRRRRARASSSSIPR